MPVDKTTIESLYPILLIQDSEGKKRKIPFPSQVILNSILTTKGSLHVVSAMTYQPTTQAAVGIEWDQPPDSCACPCSKSLFFLFPVLPQTLGCTPGCPFTSIGINWVPPKSIAAMPCGLLPPFVTGKYLGENLQIFLMR